jgi:hypothetical protein
MHITTKETREWVWATYWWAPNDSDSVRSTNSDFGADRDISGIGSKEMRERLDNYKMCTTVEFAELDDLKQRYAAELADPKHPQHSLATALLAAHEHVNAVPEGGKYPQLVGSSPPATWCSNPFVEEHPGNSHTNCIGCHQHAATGISFANTFYLGLQESDWPVFPRYGTTRVRNTFPSDFSWGYEFEVKENINRALTKRKLVP